MAERVALVTGANKGIGFAIVNNLLRTSQLTVILTSRNEDLGAQAIQQLKDLNPHSEQRLKYHQLDLTDKASIQRVATFLKDLYGGLDVLINNAGMAFKGDAFDSHVVETTIRTNFYGTMDVCDALLPLIREGGRVVNVGSTAGLLKIVRPPLRDQFLKEDLSRAELVQLIQKFVSDVAAGTHTAAGWPTAAYGMSKVAENIFTRILAREAGRPDIKINVCCPGYVNTDMSSHRGHLTPDQGAETPVFLALLPSDAPSGHLWQFKKIIDWVTGKPVE
eukprot:GILK01004198.1.p1 GENE.GILK01004198.1~~GILK01004198.1.p1  ORF type:complete len:293 (-),score=48.78 GILK01004198.1:147-977(-)